MTQEKHFDEIDIFVFISATDTVEDRPYYIASMFEEGHAGYIRIAKETITVQRPERKELIPKQIEEFKREIEKTRAEAEKRCSALEGEINKLLAIGYEVE